MPRRAEVDWIAVGLEQLAQYGHTRLTVADLCQRSGLTKGSLYHHYPDMGALRAALLQAWRERNTERLIAEAEDAGSAQQKSRVLDRLALALDPRLERAMRNWAAHETQAGDVVQAVDRQRIDYLTRLCREDGDAAAAARERATLTYALYLGLQQLFGQDELATLRRLAGRVDFVLAEAPPAPRSPRA